MIDEVSIDLRPMNVGETRTVTAWSDASPLMVAIKCFVRSPPPPGYRACPECGSIRADSGVAVEFTASPSAFRESGSLLEVIVRDGAGDQQSFQITVNVREEGSTQSHTMTA